MQIYDIFKYHPFQSSYFNNFVSDEKKLKFEIDTQSLSRVHAIKEIMKIDKDLINLGTASWTPFEDARSMIPKNEWKKLLIEESKYASQSRIEKVAKGKLGMKIPLRKENLKIND